MSRLDDMTVWCLVGNFGEGRPSVGPFDTQEEAAAFDPQDDRFEVREISLHAWIEARVEIGVEHALAQARRDAASSDA